MKPASFGQRLAWLREVGGLSGRALARIASLSKNYANEAEKRTDAYPRTETARAISDAFGIEFDWLVFGKGDPPDEEAIRRRVRAALKKMSKAA